MTVPGKETRQMATDITRTTTDQNMHPNPFKTGNAALSNLVEAYIAGSL